MCTVTFCKVGNQVVLTSNRDEKMSRPLALFPQKIQLKNTTIFAPVDPLAGGTWFGVKENKTVIVLLNGAETKHIATPPYNRSRGVVLLEILDSENVIHAWNRVDLNEVEPFTLVVYYNNDLYQLRWNGSQKSLILLDVNQCHIWSSSTLYSPDIIAQRKEWFYQFLSSKIEFLTPQDLMFFHANTHVSDTNNGLIINREGGMLTKNITQCVIEPHLMDFTHADLIEKNQETLSISIRETLVA